MELILSSPPRETTNNHITPNFSILVNTRPCHLITITSQIAEMPHMHQNLCYLLLFHQTPSFKRCKTTTHIFSNFEQPIAMHACNNLSQDSTVLYLSKPSINTTYFQLNHSSNTTQIRRAKSEGSTCQNLNSCPSCSWVLLGVAVAIRRAQKQD
ncbi:hypothetical protein QL285_005846 [Trifolium repens]|nr:hypothetical protein QL285_005846 [Trifolium repens]